MKYTLKKDYVVNDHKTLKAGAVMDVTQEFAQWLDDNGYGNEPIKAKKTKASDKKQDKDK
tara:strand:- start:322 stop:501 length:180 start_codon:yes stop_codon:yes gene_type:complete